MNERKFEQGRVVATAGVDARMKDDLFFMLFCLESLTRHQSCDWGDLCDEDKQLNENAMKYGDRLFSAYNFNGNPEDKIWIITEWDRSATTVLFPDEY